MHNISNSSFLIIVEYALLSLVQTKLLALEFHRDLLIDDFKYTEYIAHSNETTPGVLIKISHYR